jgi:aldose 1-epimerase
MMYKIIALSILLLAIIAIACMRVKRTKALSDPLTGLLIKKENFDTLVNGKKVELFTLGNKGGITVQLTNYGGYLVSILTPDKDGKYADVLMGYDNIKGFMKDDMFMGCLVGPVANRIAKGKFSIDGVNYNLFVGDAVNHLHSKPDGFHTEVFSAIQEGNRVTMTLNVPDMKTGFPGNKMVTAIYELLPNNTLRLTYSMTSDRKTICNMTNHAYFNLTGDESKTILGHLLTVYADSITLLSKEQVPSGEIVPVINTPFDFHNPTEIGKRIDTDNEQLKIGDGYDENFVLSKKRDEFGIALRLTEPESKRFLEIYTNQPAIQVYTSNYKSFSVPGKSGKPHGYRCAVALEPQKYPDAPNHPNFPSFILEPGQVYKHVSEYVFGVEK